MTTLERIIITFEQDGTFRGASATDFGGLPVHLEESDLAAVLPSLNTAALAKLETIEAEHAAAIADHVGALTQMTAARDAARDAYEEKSAYQTAMEERVSAVIQSGDPAQYEALALDFLTPAQEKIRAEKLAQIAALKAELGIE